MDNSFVSKLRLDSLYPTMPPPPGYDSPDVYDRFRNEIAPMYNRGQGGMSEGFINHLAPMQNPPSSNAKMDVIYKPPLSDEIAGKQIGADANPASDYQKGELANRQADLALKKQALGEKTGTDQQKIANEQAKTSIEDFKAKNPGILISAPKGGRIHAINKLDGSIIADLGDSGTMSESDRVNLDESDKLKNIGATGEEARKNITATGEQARQTENQHAGHQETEAEMVQRHADERAALANASREKIAGEPSKTANLPTQQHIANVNKAMEAKNSHPEWAKYITVIPGQGFSLTPPSSTLGVQTGGPTPEEYKKMNDFIYHSDSSANSEKPTAKETKKEPAAAAKPASKYKVSVSQ